MMNKQFATLDDLYLELFLRKRNKGMIIWEMKNKQTIPLKDMSDEHLINSIRILEKNEERRERYYDALSSGATQR